MPRESFMQRIALSIGLTLACAVNGVAAQEPPFPHKGNVELSVLFPAGSSADVTARLLAEGMAKRLGTNVLVIDRPGAGGAIGYKYVAAQKPDGYSLVWNSNSISTTYHAGQLAFDYKAFDAVARALIESPVLVVRADAKWKTLEMLIADAKTRPGAISVGNSGFGSHTHIVSVALFNATGTKVIDVPYGASQVVPSLIGGHVDAVVQLPGALAGQLRNGSLRALAAMTREREPVLPDVPTAREQGVDVSLDAWRGVAAPHGTPKEAIEVLENAIRQTVESSEFRIAAEHLSVRPAYLPAEQFGELIASEDKELAALMKVIGLNKQ